MSKAGDDAYTQAVGSGQYEQATGLRGKYDNVRRFWEDEVTGRFCAPFLERLCTRRHEEGRKLRLLDLGCGSGDGYQTLMTMRKSQSSLSAAQSTVISEGDVEAYTGIDLNSALLEQASRRYENARNIQFRQGDLSEGLKLQEGEAPYDVYFSSFGTMSHLHQEELVKLLSDIARQAPDGALFVGDWIGRYSIEWQNLWNTDLDSEQWMDYRISYIYPAEIRDKIEIQILPLRLMAPQEIERAVAKASEKTGVKLRIAQMFDRSLWIGRHIDTGEYNGNAQPVRENVNRLLESGVRTDLQKARVDFAQGKRNDHINEFSTKLSTQWNRVIDSVQAMIAAAEQGGNPREVLDQVPSILPGVSRSLDLIATTLSSGSLPAEIDVRADIIERLAALALREVEIGTQDGKGCGHGLVAVVEVEKK